VVSDHFARTSRCPPLTPVLPHCDLRYLTRFCELTDESVAVAFLVDMKFSFAALPALRESQAFPLLFLTVRARCDVLLCKLPLWFQRRLKRRGCAWTSCHYSRKGPFWAMCGAFRAVRIAALGNGQRMKQSSKSARLGSARAAACCRVRQLQTRTSRSSGTGTRAAASRDRRRRRAQRRNRVRRARARLQHGPAAAASVHTCTLCFDESVLLSLLNPDQVWMMREDWRRARI